MFAKFLSIASLPVLGALGASVVVTGCGAPAESTDSTLASQDEALASKCPPSVPSVLAVPDGNKLASAFDAVGVQIYACTATSTGYSWVFSAPEANLLDPGGNIVATHYAGPTWESSEDGSKVVASKVAAYTADPTCTRGAA